MSSSTAALMPLPEFVCGAVRQKSRTDSGELSEYPSASQKWAADTVHSHSGVILKED